MKKFPLIYFISLIFTVYCFSSCINITESDSDSQFVSGENIYSQNQKTITLTGKIGMDGAVPEELMPFCSVQNSNRAAVPSISVEDGCEYFIEAVCGSETPVEGNVNVADGTYSINLVLGKKYTITAGIRKSGNVALSDSWLLDELTREKAAAGITHDFVLTTAKGVGDITLKITVPATVKSVTAECSESGWTNISLEEDSETANLWILRTTSSITSGQYEVTLYFRNESNILLYATTQAINVFKGLETKIWRDSGSTDQLISDGNFALTQAIIESYARTQIYVGSTEVGNVALDATGNDLGAGTPYSPFAYLDSAFALIENANSTQNAYTIWVTGTISKTSTLNTTKAKSVSIVGTTLMNNGVPQDSLDGGENGTVLTINTSILVKIRKLKITNGNASALNDNCGGGLYIDGGANVILENGALVGDENKIPSSTTDVTAANKAINGGGIYIKNGLLTMKKGSKVRGNYAGSSSDTEYTNGGGGIACVKGSVILENGSEISYNAAFARGGGILLNKTTDDVTLKIKGGSVSHNEVYSWGGGVYVGSATFNMQGGEISYNKTVGTGDVDGRSFGGGGICCASGTTIISGGEISENTAAHLTKGSGAVKIEAQNSFTIQDSAKIPYGVTGTDGTVSKGIGKNDIGVRGYENSQGNYIYIKTVLTEIENFTIGITLTEEWKRGLRIANGNIQINNYLPYFEFTNTASDWTGELAGNYNIQTNAPIYVAGATTHPVCNVAGSDESTADGSKTAPFATIEKACEGMNNTGINYIIKIDGEVIGAQQIPSTLKKVSSGTYKAKSVTLSGATGNTTDSLKGGFTSSSNGTTLKILTDVPVTIKNLKITGGYAAQTSAGGGGLYTNGDVTLSQGALVSGNYTASCGGGIYNDSKILTVEDGAEISGNYEKGVSNCGGGAIFNYGGTLIISGGVIKSNTADHDGGAIYNDGERGTCYIYGNTLIGKEVTAAPGEWYNGSNKAENGGAICVNGGNVYIGYKKNSGTAQQDSEASVKVMGNAVKPSSSKGGGIYVVAGSLQIAKTCVAYNYSPKDGGGIYTTGVVRLLEDAVIKGNSAFSYGGGVHINKKGSLSMTSNSIIGGSETGDANKAASGGGVYVASNSSTTGDEATVTFGTSGASATPSISGNSATSGGGGVYVENFAATFNMNSGTISNNKVVGGTTGGGGVEISYGTFNMNGGTISENYIENPGTSTLGGAVDINTNGTFNIKGTVSIPYGGEKYLNDVSARGNPIKIAGAITLPEGVSSVATVIPKNYTDTILELGTSPTPPTTLANEVGKFRIVPASGTFTFVEGLGYGLDPLTGKYSEEKILVSDSSDEVLSAMNDLIANSTRENPVNLCFTTDFVPSSYVPRENDSNFTNADGIIRVMKDKAVNITATHPITIKNTFGGNGCIVYCENGSLYIGPNITIEQKNSSSDEYGVRVNGGDAIIDGCEIKNSKGKGLNVWSGKYSSYGWNCPYANVTVNAGTKIHDCGSGIFIYQDSSKVALNGGEIYNCKESGIYITAQGKVICPDSSAVSIHDNTYSNSACQVYFYNNSGGWWGDSEGSLQNYTKNLKWTTFPQ